MNESLMYGSEDEYKAVTLMLSLTINAWGESHLWFRRRKESKLSGFVEPRIPVDLSRGVSNLEILRKRIPAYKKTRSSY